MHGRRLDDAAKSRKVRDEPSLTWTPEGLEDDAALALSDRLADHLQDVFVPKSPTGTQALHMIVKLPDSVPVATREEAEAAMKLAVQFAQDTFGGRAVFSARMDRDEVSLNNVDVFLAPVYEKKTKHTSKMAMSLTRHLKQLIEKTPEGEVVKHASAKESKQDQGKALQTALAKWLNDKGYYAERGVPKLTKGKDWEPPELVGKRKDFARAQEAFAEYVQTEAGMVVARLQESTATLDDAKAEAERILADAQKLAAEAREHADAAARSAASAVLAKAEADAVRIRREAKDDADRVAAEAIRDRDLALGEVAADRLAVDAEKIEVAGHSKMLTALIAELEPVLAVLRKASDDVRRRLDRDDGMLAARKAVNPLLDRARAAVRLMTKGPPPVDPAAPDVLAAAREAQKGAGRD